MSIYRRYNKFKNKEYDEGYLLKTQERYLKVLQKFEEKQPELFKEFMYAYETMDYRQRLYEGLLISVMIIIFFVLGYVVGYEFADFMHTIKALIP